MTQLVFVYELIKFKAVVLFCSPGICFPIILYVYNPDYLWLPILYRCYLSAGDIDRGLQTFEDYMNAGRLPAVELYVVSLAGGQFLEVQTPNQSLLLQQMFTCVILCPLLWVRDKYHSWIRKLVVRTCESFIHSTYCSLLYT